MQSKISAQSKRPNSANNNGPLTNGQVKALKAIVAILGVLILAALLTIIARVIYLSTAKGSAPVAVALTHTKLQLDTVHLQQSP